MSVRSLEDYTEDQLKELADTITEEEFEQLDELSKTTLSSYMGKAVDDIVDTRARPGKKPLVTGMEGKNLRNKRAAGMRKAATKYLAKKEETDPEEDEDNLEENAAQDSIKPHAVVFSEIIHKMSGMSHDDITKLAAVLNQVGNETKNLPAKANAAANRGSITAHNPVNPMRLVKEDLVNLFGEDTSGLSEEFINKTTTLFEAAVNMRVDIERVKMFDEASELVEEMVEEHIMELEERLDGYLNLAVNEWIEENALAVETGIRTMKMESFLDDLKSLMLAHNIDIPSDKEDVVESLMGEIDDLKNQLDEQIEVTIEKDKLVSEANRSKVFDEVSEGLAATQVEKLRTLCEGIETETLDDYRAKIAVIKDTHFKDSKAPLTEEVETNNESELKNPVTDASMNRYSQAISKSLRK